MSKLKKLKEDEEEWMKAAGGGRGDDELMSVWQSREICVTCMVRVNSGERGLRCDLCNRWFHAECEKVNRKNYELMGKLETSWKWFCNRCDCKMDDVKEGYKNVEKRLEEVEEEMKNMRKEIEDRKEKMDYMEAELRKLKTMNSDSWKALKEDMVLVEQQVDEHIKKKTQSVREETSKWISEMNERSGRQQEKHMEMLKKEVEEIKKKKYVIEETEQSKKKREQEMKIFKEEVVSMSIEEVKKSKNVEDKKVEQISLKLEEIERERKKKNVIMFNLKESLEGEAEKRYKEDLERSMKIFAVELGIQDLTIEKVFRIGKKQDDMNRPMIIKLGSEEDRLTVLRKAKILRHSEEFGRVYISRDMTEAEREKDKQLRQDLREKREKNEGGSYVIRRGKVMQIREQGARRKVRQSGQDF